MDEQSRMNLVKKKAAEYIRKKSDYAIKQAELMKRRASFVLHEDIIALDLECKKLLDHIQGVKSDIEHFAHQEDFTHIPELKEVQKLDEQDKQQDSTESNK